MSYIARRYDRAILPKDGVRPVWRRFWSGLEDLPFAGYLIAIITVGLLGPAAIVLPGVAGWYAGDRRFA